MAAAEAIVRAPSGYVVLSDARIVGTVDVGMASGGHGEVSLTNVLTLDCSFCHELSQVGDLPWAELLLTPQLNFFCTCDLADERGIRVASADAKLSAAFTISNQLIAHSEWGSMSLSEVVIVPSIASHNGTIGSIGPPTLSCNTTYGNIELNQVIAEASAASNYHVVLRSFGGNVKALFTGGGLRGSYAVVTEPGGIGHVGIG